MIDWQRVEELRAEFGAEGLNELVLLFLEEVEGVLARLETQPDAARFEEDMHFLKGSALNLGFQQVSDLCERSERLAADGRAAEVNPADVLRCYAASKSAFMARAGRYGIALIAA